ncbi:MAG: hypothetical protein KTR31_31355 [Myxococcales bacterium]|nr:hypothetical protein [Myxococcales bacterium]
MMRWIVCGVGLALGACEMETRQLRGSSDPPEQPAHDEDEDGARHARGYEVPYLCGDPSGGGFAACPDDVRPEPNDLSCDASGCHGGYDFDPGTAVAERHLRGSEGPSCWACHLQREWSTQTTGTASGEGDD